MKNIKTLILGGVCTLLLGLTFNIKSLGIEYKNDTDYSVIIYADYVDGTDPLSFFLKSGKSIDHDNFLALKKIWAYIKHPTKGSIRVDYESPGGGVFMPGASGKFSVYQGEDHTTGEEKFYIYWYNI